MGDADQTYRCLPARDATLIVGFSTSRGQEISPFRDILFSLLPPDLYLLLLATATQVILLERTLVFILWEKRRLGQISRDNAEYRSPVRSDAPFLRVAAREASMAAVVVRGR